MSDGYILINITNPAPGAGVPDTDHNNLYRRKTGESTWVRIATGISKNGSYKDYAVASGQSYDYKVTAISVDDTSADSGITADTWTQKGVWLHDPTDGDNTCHQFVYDGQGGRSEQVDEDMEMFEFAGRSKPVAEFGELERQRMTVNLQLLSASDRDTLRSLIRRKATLCYRDGYGRKIFGVIAGWQINDQLTSWWTVTIELQEVYYSEAV